jgi:hypothetical protein
VDQDLLDRFRQTAAVTLQVLDDKIVRDDIASIPPLLEKQITILSRIEDRLGDIIDLLRE